MKVARLFCVSVVFSTLAFAGAISGTVVEASNNEPVRKAVVTLTLQGAPREWATTRTDNSGAFRFEALPAGKYDLRATKVNEGTAVYGASSLKELGELISLEEGEIRAGVKLRFLRSSTVSGRVLDPEGDPVAEIMMSLLKPGLARGERALLDYRFASTNERGEYKFNDVAPGQYYVHASQPMELGGSEPLTPQFLGGGREAKDSAMIGVHGDETLTGVDFHMVSEPRIEIHGHATGVPDRGGNPLFEISPADEYVGNWWRVPLPMVSPENPTFVFGPTPQGRYRIDASMNAEGKTWTASRLIDTRDAPEEIIMELAPARDIKGKLRIEGAAGVPASDFEIRLSQGRYRPIILAHPAADGGFTVTQVPPGTWLLSVNGLPSDAFVKSARFGDKDIRSAPMEVKPDSEESLNIVVSMNSAQIHGKAEARAGILLSATTTRLYYDVSTDDEGRFELKGIAPGKYKIFALEKLTAADFKTPEAATELGSLGEEIELAEGASVEVNPKLVPVERAREALP